MASIITAVKNIQSDNFWGAKLLVLTLIAFALFSNSSTLKENTQNYVFAWGLFVFLMLGVSSFMMNRNINNRTPLLPNIFHIILVIKDAIFMSIIVAPFSLIMYYSLNYYNNNFKFQEEVVLNYFFWFAIIFTCVPFIFIPAVLYSVRGNFFDAFRIKNILYGAGNFIVQAISFCLQYVFTLVILTFLIYKIFEEMLGPETVFIPIVFSFFSVLSFLTVFSFCSDLYIDVIPQITEIKDFRGSSYKKNAKYLMKKEAKSKRKAL